MATQLPQGKEQALDQVVQRFTLAQQKQNPDFKRFDRYYKLFRNYIPKGNLAWRSRIFVPYVYSTIQTMLSKMVANDPTIEFAPRNEESADKAKLMSKLFDYQWSKAGGFAKLVDWLLVTLLFGKGIVKIYWRFEKEEVQYNKYELLGLRKTVGTKNKVLFDGPDFDVVDPLDLFIDPQAKTVNEAQWVIHRTYPTLENLKDTQTPDGKPLYNLPPDEEMMGTKQDPYYNEGMGDFKQRRARVTGPVPAVKDTTVDRVELLEHWTNEEVVTVANKKHIIRREDNPFWDNRHPFVEMIDSPIPFDFYKMGTVEPIETLQHALNDTRNQRLDNVNLSLNRMWKVGKTGDVDEHELVSRPGGVIHVGQMDALEPFETPDVTQSSYREEEAIKYDIQQGTGISDFYAKGVGNDSVANRTATGAKLITEETNNRVKFKMKFLDDALENLGTKWHARNEQFIDSTIALRITGAGGTKIVKLSPQDVAGDYDIIPVSGSTEPINKQAQVTQYINWYQQMVNTYPIWGRQVQVNWHEIVTDFSQKFGINNLDKIFPAASPPLQPGQALNGATGVMPQQSEMPGMTPAESMPQGQIQGGDEQQGQDQQPDKVSIAVKDPAIAIELLGNRGELKPEQVQQLHQVVTLPQAQQQVTKAATDAHKVTQQGALGLLKQKHQQTQLEVEANQSQQQQQQQNEQTLTGHKVGIFQSLMQGLRGNSSEKGGESKK